MARQQGVIAFTGKLNGLSYYKRNNQYWVRMPGGPSREQIRHSPSCVRIQESNDEFTGATQVAKTFRTSLPTAILNMKDTYFSVRLNGVFKRMCDLGEGIRGQRSISTAQHGKLLRGFAFTKGVPFDSVFQAKVSFSVNPERTEVYASASSLRPMQTIRFPKAATHFRLLFSVVSLCDYISTDKVYAPVLPAFNGLSAMTESAILPLDSTLSPFVLRAGFAQVTHLPVDVALVLCMGIVFYQRVDGVDYVLADGSCAGVVEVL